MSTPPKILGKPMRHAKPARLPYWTWRQRPIAVDIYQDPHGFTARIWILGGECTESNCYETLAQAARWADRRLRAVLGAMLTAQGRVLR